MSDTLEIDLDAVTGFARYDEFALCALRCTMRDTCMLRTMPKGREIDTSSSTPPNSKLIRSFSVGFWDGDGA